MAHILREEPGAVFEYDGEAKALYYRLTHAPVVRTVDIGGRVMVDVDAAGHLGGERALQVFDEPAGVLHVLETTS